VLDWVVNVGGLMCDKNLCQAARIGLTNRLGSLTEVAGEFHKVRILAHIFRSGSVIPTGIPDYHD
jgi:hypothetical protein